MRHPRPVLVACLIAVLAAAVPALGQDVAPPVPPRMAAGIADQYHGPGAFVRVACSATCDVKGTIKVTPAMKRFLRMRFVTVGAGKGHLDGAGTANVLVDLTNRAIRAVRQRGGNQLPVTLTATARDSDGRSSRLTKKLTIPL